MKAEREITVGSVEELRSEFARVSALILDGNEQLKEILTKIDEKKADLTFLVENYLIDKERNSVIITSQFNELDDAKKLFLIEKDELASKALKILRELERNDKRDQELTDRELSLNEKADTISKGAVVLSVKENTYQNNMFEMAKRQERVEERERKADVYYTDLKTREENIIARENKIASDEEELKVRVDKSIEVKDALFSERERFEKDKIMFELDKVAVTDAKKKIENDFMEMQSKKTEIENRLASVEAREKNSAAKEDGLKFREAKLVMSERDLQVRNSQIK